MAKKFSELVKKMSPDAQKRATERARAMMDEMPLHELRRARGLSQENLAATLKVNQAAISKLERRADMYISTLRSHVEAMGGRLYIVAHFPEGDVRIQNFSDTESDAVAKKLLDADESRSAEAA